MNWIPNQWKGERLGELYVGQTPKGYWRVWIAGEMQPEIYRDKATAKAAAQNRAA